ncbi:MAG: hypothetical protein DRH10_00885, partial [Deltaproteobacteria bacterium]
MSTHNIPIYTGSVGINNRVPPVRLPFDQETGITALEKAEDVLINPSGQITTLRGRELVVLGPYH